MSIPTSNPDIPIRKSLKLELKESEPLNPEPKKSESIDENGSIKESKRRSALPKKHAEVSPDKGSLLRRCPTLEYCGLSPRNPEHRNLENLSPEAVVDI